MGHSRAGGSNTASPAAHSHAFLDIHCISMMVPGLSVPKQTYQRSTAQWQCAATVHPHLPAQEDTCSPTCGCIHLHHCMLVSGLHGNAYSLQQSTQGVITGQHTPVLCMHFAFQSCTRPLQDRQQHAFSCTYIHDALECHNGTITV